MIENEEDASVWEDIERSEETFSSWVDAYDAGQVALNLLVLDERIGPRAPGEDEDADPVG